MVQGKPSQDVPENVPPSRPGPEQRQPSEATIRSMSSASSTGTVRRVSTDEGPYVDLSSSADSYNTAQESPSHAERSYFPPSRRASIASVKRAASPDRLKRKPSFVRGSSSVSKMRPEFSADDYKEEVAEGFRRTARSGMPTGYQSVRRTSTLRRRPTAASQIASETDDDHDNDDHSDHEDGDNGDTEEGTVRPGSMYEASDAGTNESFTLKDRQEAINVTHPFGIRIWKPALYKKFRSVQRRTEEDIHSGPDARVGGTIILVNILWIPIFGIWLSLACLIPALNCYLFAFTGSGRAYGDVFLGLSGYLLYPFGKFVEMVPEDAYLEEDEGEGRSITEYEQWQQGDLEEGGTSFFGPRTPRSIIGRRRASMESASEVDSLLGRSERRSGYAAINSESEGSTSSPNRRAKRRLFGRGEWNLGRIIFFCWYYLFVAPLLWIVSIICWGLVFTIPMAKVLMILIDHVRRHPLALSFRTDSSYRQHPESPHASILVCTHRAAGWKYYKYTIDGTNIFFINLMSVVVFVLVDYFLLRETLEIEKWYTSSGVIFTLALASIIPLAYFIGQAVASISAQSSMGMGATINAFFSTIVEVYLYCVALKDGKGRLVEGSIVGSILAGILFMPGISMCSGAIVRKTQRFNAKSAGVTSTMLLFAVIGAFAPTLFYQIYGTYELKCRSCYDDLEAHIDDTDCQRCIFSQMPSLTDKFYLDAVRPFCYIASFFLFCAYATGLWFTLRTHAASIWQTETEQKQQSVAPPPPPVRIPSNLGRDRGMPLKDSTLYKRVLGGTVNTVGLNVQTNPLIDNVPVTPHIVPPRTEELDRIPEDDTSSTGTSVPPVSVPGLSQEANVDLTRSVAEVAAAAATLAVQESQRHRLLQKPSSIRLPSNAPQGHGVPGSNIPGLEETEELAPADAPGGEGGHDAPNWGKTKSAVILIGATVMYAAVAEVLVDTVDVILNNLDVDEKFLGMTLFALVPNTTEFLNAISFAMNGNIALSMEIGSAYALQVCMLQIPCLVAWSAYTKLKSGEGLLSHTFTLIFPQWDMVTVILCVFLLSYMYGEGKSNYFKGSILLLSYCTVMLGFYFSVYADPSVEKVGYGRAEFTSIAAGARGWRPPQPAQA